MDRISRRQAVRGAGAAAAMMLGSPSVHAQNDRQTLRFVAQADLKILDPIWTTAYITRNHGYLVYDTLFGTDEQFRIKPQMVGQTTVSPDGMKYTFTLRDGLRWHDGQPVLSEDCVEIIAQWRDGFQAHVAAALNRPLVVFEQQSPDQASDGIFIREDADHIDASLDFPLQPFKRIDGMVLPR